MKINVSFEFFPPKSNTGEIQLRDAACLLARLSPNFFSVTFGAGGTTRDGTLNTIHMLQANTSIPVTPHLACIGSTKTYILELLHRYRNMGLTRIVALRGDLPAHMENSTSEFFNAVDLVKFIRDETHEHFHIEVAAYPEMHPQAQNLREDVLNLKRKFDAGANSAITQYFFNPDAYFYFIDECARQGIAHPIIPGIMPITHFARLQRFSQICGAEIPRWLYKRLEAYGDDEESVKAFGLEVVYHLCQKLIKGGVPGLHFYTLNQAETNIRLLQLLGLKNADFAM